MKNTLLFFVLLSSTALAQNLTGTRFFIKSFIDVSDGTQYVEAARVSTSYPEGDYEYLRVSGDCSFGKFTLGAEASTGNEDGWDFVPTYLMVGGRYNFNPGGELRIAAGALAEFSYPFEKYNDYFISVFSAARYNLSNVVELCGSLRLKGPDYFGGYELLAGFGSILHVSYKFNFIAEIKMTSNSQLGGGFEYRMFDQLLLKGALFTNLEKSYTIIAALSYTW